MADISIIIPVLNEQAGIESFLHALQALRPHCELLLVDGGSDDNTVALAQPYVDDIVFSDAGRAIQMNIGAAMATSPILLFLHADTYLPDNVLEQISCAINHHRWGRFDVKLTGEPIILIVVAWLMNIRSRWTGIATGDQAIFVEKSLFEQLNGFADISLMEDIELSTRLNKLAKPYCSKSKVFTSGRRWINFGVFKTISLMWWLRLQYFLGASPERLVQLYQKGNFWKV